MPAVITAVLLLASFALAGSALAQSGDCAAPPAMTDGWQTESPASVGLDAAALCRLGPRLQEWQEADVHAVLVVRHGKLVYEKYFAGTDQPLGDKARSVTFDASAKHDLRSVEKSIVSLLVGIAIGQGKMAGIDQPALPQLADYADLRSAEKDRITLRHLLTMSLGLAWNEDLPLFDPHNNETQMYLSSNPLRYAMAQPVEFPPGTVYRYDTGSVVILSALLEKATGVKMDDFARTVLFGPLGITDIEWMHLPTGFVLPFGLRMRPRDLAKIGQLVLDHGAWHGKQIVPADWVQTAITPQINGQQLYFYGYLFWLGRSLLRGQEVDWAAGVGLGGQRLFIIPKLDLVVLVHAGLYNSPIQSIVPLIILDRFVLPAVEAQ
jgi:CubicO group peptidase (beta-lactamase class C family)